MGTRVTRAALHLSLEEVQQRMRTGATLLGAPTLVGYLPRPACPAHSQRDSQADRRLGEDRPTCDCQLQPRGRGGHPNARHRRASACLSDALARTDLVAGLCGARRAGRTGHRCPNPAGLRSQSRPLRPQEDDLSAAGSSWLAQAGASSPPS